MTTSAEVSRRKPGSRSDLEDVLREQRLGFFYRNRLKKVQRAERRANQMRNFSSELNHIMKSLPTAATISKQDQWLHPSKIQADAWFSFVRHKYHKPLLKKLHEWLADAQGKRCAGYNHRERWWRNLPGESTPRDDRVPIFVIGLDRAHTLHLKRSDTMADVNAAVERLGYDLSVDRLCRFGGASLPRDDSVSIAESGLQPNSSLHVLGRVRGGAEVPLFGQQHSLGDTGLLDLKGQDVGPAKLKEVASFFSSPKSNAVCRLVLSGNMVTDRGKDMSGMKALCTVLPTLKHPISLDLANCGLGANKGSDVSGLTTLCDVLPTVKNPVSLDLADCSFDVAEINKLAQVILAGAAVNSLTLSSTGDITNQQTYTLTAYADEIELVQKNLGPADVNLLAVWMTTSAGATVARLSLKGNMPCGRISRDNDGDAPWLPGKNFSAWISLCESFEQCRTLIEIDVSECYLGPGALNPLAKAVASMAVALQVVILDGNPIGYPSSASARPRAATGVAVKEGVFAAVEGRFGEVLRKIKHPNLRHDEEIILLRWLDDGQESEYLCTKTKRPTSVVASRSDLIENYAHIQSLGEALSGSKVHTCRLADCRFNPATLATFVASVTWAEAALVEVVILDGNPIGYPLSVSVHPGAATGVPVKKGTFAAVDGRFGEVIEGPDSDSEVRLRWLHDGSESNWTKVDKLTSVVATRSDLIEDYSHIRSLGEALSGSRVHTCGLGNCKLNAGSLGAFVESVRWAHAVVASLKLTGVDFGSIYTVGNALTTCTRGHQLVEVARLDNHRCDVCRAAAPTFRWLPTVYHVRIAAMRLRGSSAMALLPSRYVSASGANGSAAAWSRIPLAPALRAAAEGQASASEPTGWNRGRLHVGVAALVTRALEALTDCWLVAG